MLFKGIRIKSGRWKAKAKWDLKNAKIIKGLLKLSLEQPEAERIDVSAAHGTTITD